MAFRMNRPIIKGTANHKASIAKAKAQSVVSQSRTKADAGLIAASNALGKSYKPSEIDFELDKIDIDVPEKKEKKEKQPRVKKEKKVKVKKEKEPKVKKEKGENIFEKGYKGIRDFIKEKNQKKLNERLRKAEEGPDSDYDFSELDKEPGLDTKKTEKYKSPEAGTKEGEELLSRTKAGRNKALQDAAKKYNVKVEDLEAKHIGPENEPLTKEEIEKYGKNYVRPSDLAKRQFYPKQDVVGGKEETQWDDKLGRFRKPEATTGTEEEQKAALEKMKPKFPEGMDPNLATTGEIALNYETNTYEYTQQYFDRLAKEKIEQQEVKPTSNTTEPVVEEKKTLSKLEIRKKRMADRKYNNPDTSQYIKDQMIKEGYVPNESKSPAEMRDNRIYRNAIKGGIVQQNMLKSGYKPE